MPDVSGLNNLIPELFPSGTYGAGIFFLHIPNRADDLSFPALFSAASVISVLNVFSARSRQRHGNYTSPTVVVDFLQRSSCNGYLQTMNTLSKICAG